MLKTRISRRVGREVRRQDLVNAALAVFSAKGVAATSVDDIVRAAGVAKGTFYLYFTTKDDAVTAVAEQMVEAVATRIEADLTTVDRSPVERLVAMGGAMRQVGGKPHERELIKTFHRPENRAIHDRMSERAFARLAPRIAEIIADGIELGLFRSVDPRRAAAYVMACFGSLHEVVKEPTQVPAATLELDGFILRGLGYDGELPT